MPMLALAGAVITAGAAIYQGIAQKQALEYQSQVAANNAITAQRQAQYAIEAGREKSQQESLKQAAIGGEIKAAQGASGVDVNTGSNVAVQKSHRMLGALDTETTMNNAELTAYGYRTQAANFQAQSGLYAYEAPQAEIGADIGAAGTVAGAAGKWYAPTTQGA